ncbi:MAG TPA: D-glycero-beta-D-manno-heptose 1-phosphate adenylyltransferase [Candidatus Binatia bacterium]|nr:D-glycero-beta-D-manno-heptose 1-phosphate adenylyltransferase [Candidatus Binatia bacterium]
MPGKLKRLDELEHLTSKAKAQGKKIVFTNGCFDILHRGHVHLLRAAKALGDLLVVAVNSDSSIKQIKGPRRPVVSQAGRVELIEALEMVDYVVLFDEPDPCNLLAALKPDVLVKGGDYGRETVVGADIVESNGGKVAVVPFLEGFSTSDIIERVRR